MVSFIQIGQLPFTQKTPIYRKRPGACFSKAPENFQAHKTSYMSSLSKSGEVYMPEDSCMKGTCAHIKNTLIKQPCDHKVRHFCYGFPGAKTYLGPSRNRPFQDIPFILEFPSWSKQTHLTEIYKIFG